MKLFGSATNRATASMQVLEEVSRSGSHWACTYPSGRRPRSVRDGATMFMGRLTKDPHQILIYGRATGMRYKEGRDDATEAEIAKRPWKAKWPHYVRVHHPEFVSGALGNGVALGQLIEAKGVNAFVATQRNAPGKAGNRNPRLAYRQQPAVELTTQAAEWLSEALERQFNLHGRISQVELDALDWPTPTASH